MQKRASLFVLVAFVLGLATVGLRSATQAQDTPSPTPTPYIVASMSVADGYKGEVYTQTGSIKLNPADLEMIQKQIEADMANGKEVFVAGKETLGAVLDIAGKAIQLPPNVYSEAFIVSATGCAPCPEFPVYVLRYDNLDTTILVSVRSGKISDAGGVDAEKAASNRDAFQWLTDALAKEGIAQ